MIFVLACVANKQNIDTSAPLTSEPLEQHDTGATEHEVDLDGDGYPSWIGAPEQAIADCNDSDDRITPNSVRWIPAGPFTRGNDERLETSPARQITLSSYCIDRLEVSNQQFADFLNVCRILIL